MIKRAISLAVAFVGIAAAQSVVPSLLSASMGPQISTGAVYRDYVFTFSNMEGSSSIGIVNILMKDSISGVGACYLAYDRASQNLYLMNDTGTQLLPPARVGSRGASDGALSNNQCAVDGAASYVETTSYQIGLHLRLRPYLSFNSVFWLATRSLHDELTSGWIVGGVWIR